MDILVLRNEFYRGESHTMKTLLTSSTILTLLMATLLGFAQEEHCSTPITEADVLQAQQVWGKGIVAIGNAYLNGQDYIAVATKHVDDLYAYREGVVLFKPTKAAAQQFRLTRPEAISYFVRGTVYEDKGFALQPWSNVRFENADIITDSDSAVAMGNYFFTDANTGQEAKVEYTFGYTCGDNGLVINVHHSAFPYSPSN